MTRTLRGRADDIHALHAHWASKLDDLRYRTPVRSLLLDGDRVAGLMLGMVFGPRAVEAVVSDKEENDGP